jgi:hypothetical protein
MINKKQVQIIHVLKSKLGMDETTYRDILATFKVASSKSLTGAKAKELINLLVGQMDDKFISRPGQLPYEELGERKGYASPKQLRMLAAMWSDVSVQPDAASKRKAFRRFLRNRFGVSHEAWLPRHMVERVKKTLDAMRKD